MISGTPWRNYDLWMRGNQAERIPESRFGWKGAKNLLLNINDLEEIDKLSLIKHYPF